MKAVKVYSVVRMGWLASLLFGAGPNAVALEDVLPWREPEAPYRAVFEPLEPFPEVYLELPAEIEGHGPVERASAWIGDRAVAFAVAEVAGGTLRAVVSGLDEPSRDAALVVYLFAGSEGVPIAPEAELPPVSRFVAATVARAAGRDAPPSWTAMRHVWMRRGAQEKAYRLEGFAPFSGEGEGGWFPEKRGPRNYLARLTARFRLRAPLRRFRPALRAPTRAFARIDGAPAISAPPREAGEPWAIGEPQALTAGVHEIVVYQWCHKTIDVRLGMAAGENGSVKPFEAVEWLPPNPPPEYRGERLRFPLQPDMEVARSPAYGFAGVETLFTPVRLRNKTVSWLDEEVQAEWFVDGARIGAGDDLGYVFAGEGPYRVTLRVVDPLGFRGETVRDVAFSGPPADEFQIDAGWRGLPPAAYPRDPLRPELWLAGACPEDLRFEVAVTNLTGEAVGGNGPELGDAEIGVLRWSLSLQQGWGRVALRPVSAGDSRSFAWSVSHAGRLLVAGRVRFVRPPFRDAPVRAVGDALFDARGRVVYLPRRRAAETPAVRPVLGPEGLCWIDGAMAPRHAFTTRAIETVVERLGLALGMPASGPGTLDRVDWESLVAGRAGADLAGSLAALAELPVRGRAVLISLGPEALRDGEPPDRFERRLAVMTGLLRDALGASPVLVTPPPRPGGEALRPYAEAVHRVADAHALPVADLYSVIRGAEAPEGFVDEDGLTEAGFALAGRLIAECFTREAPAHPAQAP